MARLSLAARHLLGSSFSAVALRTQKRAVISVSSSDACPCGVRLLSRVVFHEKDSSSMGWILGVQVLIIWEMWLLIWFLLCGFRRGSSIYMYIYICTVYMCIYLLEAAVELDRYKCLAQHLAIHIKDDSIGALRGVKRATPNLTSKVLTCPSSCFGHLRRLATQRARWLHVS